MKNNFQMLLAFVAITISVAACRSCGVVVKERPPATVYARPAPPRANYVWVEGEYVRSGRGYAYRPGYWIAPKNNKVYRQGYWQQTRRGYVWVPGRW